MGYYSEWDHDCKVFEFVKPFLRCVIMELVVFLPFILIWPNFLSPFYENRTNSGIGEEITLQLVSRGYGVVAVARTEAMREKYAGNERIAVVLGDIVDPEVSKRAVETAVTKFGHLDAVVANAGVLDPVGPLGATDIADWRRLFDINVFSVVQLIGDALPELRKSGGRVVAVSLGASVGAYDGWSAYGASKAALNHIVSQLAAQEQSVSAIAVAPGVVDTAMQQDIRDKFGSNMKPEALKRFTDLHEQGKLLPVLVPAAVYVGLAINGWDPKLNGMYLRHDDERLKKEK